MRSPRWSALDVALLLTVACHVLVRLLYADFVPLYDSRQYFDDCLLPYFATPWNPLKLNCFGHPSLAFMAVIALGQALDVGSTLLLHASTTALGVASIFAFHRLVARLLTGPELLWERRLLVACYGLGPVCLAYGVNFNPDYGVLTFFVLMLERLIAGRLLLAAVFGTCLMLSKESGVLLYGVSGFAFALHTWIRPRAVPPLPKLAKQLGLLAAPVLAFVIVKLAELSSGMPVVWGGEQASKSILPMFLSFELLDPVFLMYSFDVLALGFNWILGVPMVVFAAGAALRKVINREKAPPAGFDLRVASIVLTVFGLAFVLLTRFRTFNNVRYLAPLSPLLIVSAGYALCALGMSARGRRLLLGLSLVFTFSFNFHSLDPVSQGFFGSFDFGRPSLLKLGGFDVCCGYGRDQLVYNLQFTELHYLQDAIYRELRPTPDTPLVAADLVEFHFSGRVDSRTFERTLRTEGSHEIKLVHVSKLLQSSVLPEQIYFLVFPNFDNGRAYAQLAQRYAEVGRRTFQHGDYSMLVHMLQLKR